MDVKRIGLGTAAIGRPQYINIKEEPSAAFDIQLFKEKGIKTLDAAYEQGIRYFDTAPGYGLAEQLLIDWVKNKGDASIEVATKWGYSYVANFDPNATVHEIKDHSLSQLNRQWKTSKQLFPYLKTLQIHSATFEIGVLEDEKVLAHLDELKHEHNILIGLTTTGHNQVEVVKKALDIHITALPLFDVYQITYNILDQSLLTVINDLEKSDRRVVIKEALANGRLFRNGHYPKYAKMYDALEEMAGKYDVGVDAIALRFCFDSVNPFKVLSGAASDLHIVQNLKSLSFQLESEDIHMLKSFRQNPKFYWSERKQLGWN